jgi:hypothetical protein
MNLVKIEREKLNFDSAMKTNAQMLTKAGAVTVALLGLLTLCIGLSECVSSTLATPKGELRSHGTIAAVNAADRTIEIKTNEGEPLVVSVLAAT